jgi:hypothetical protein
MFIARQRLGNQVPAATNTSVTIEVLLGYDDGNSVSIGVTRGLFPPGVKLPASDANRRSSSSSEV